MNHIFTQADRDFAEGLFTTIARETADPEGGVLRPSYGNGETRAWNILAEAARDLGLQAGPDLAGNLLITRDLKLNPRNSVWIGSHLDAVPRGGNYDGLAGVIAGLLIVAKMLERGVPMRVTAIGLRGEESAWFGEPYLGSKVLLYGFHPELLQQRRRAIGSNDPCPTLRECLATIQVERPRPIESKERAYWDLHLEQSPIGRLQPIVTKEDIRAFWELHIEQGPVLVDRKKPIGIVTGIRGNVRAPNARIVGKAGHSGTTPHDLRDDAVMKFVEIMSKLEERRQDHDNRAEDLVFTCGIVGTVPAKHAITTIADELRLSLDVRSLWDSRPQEFLRYAESLGVDLGQIVSTSGATLSRNARRACEAFGVPYEIMPSGAGHDAAVFQRAGVPSGMIFIRNANGSHNPDEALSTDDFLIGCEMLWRAVVEDFQQ
jgi:beta-ureidopropionase / N-carbamoyl-L-amino-acid hydrolase